MRHRILQLLALVSLLPASLAAQQAPPDTVSAQLRQRIEERLAARVQERLGLDDTQTAKLREVARGWAQRRRTWEREQRELRRALAEQMRPGVAASQDSVTRLTQRLLDVRVAYAESFRNEYRELGFLTPVQRAQYFAMRERVLDVLRRLRDERADERMGPGGRWRRLRPQ